MDIELKELSNIYLQTLKEEEDGAAGEGQNPQQSVDVGSHAKSIRYQSRRDNVPLPKAFNDYVAKNQLSGAERTALRQKLGFMESTELSEKKGCNHTHKGEECEIHGMKECPSMPVEEEEDYKSKDKIMKKAKPLHNHLYKNLHKGDTEGDVNESRHFSWREELRELVDVTSSKPKTDEKSNEKITEKKVKNKIVINPPQGMTEAIEEIGGQILEMVEIEEGDFPKDAPSIKDAKPAKKTDVKYDPHMKVMAPTVKKEEVGSTSTGPDPETKKQLAAKEQMMRKQQLLSRQRLQMQKQGKLPSGHMEGLSIDQQMKISQDYNRMSPEDKLAANKKTLGTIKKVKREKDTRTDAQKMTDATGPRPGSRYRGD